MNGDFTFNTLCIYDSKRYNLTYLVLCKSVLVFLDPSFSLEVHWNLSSAPNFPNLQFSEKPVVTRLRLPLPAHLLSQHSTCSPGNLSPEHRTTAYQCCPKPGSQNRLSKEIIIYNIQAIHTRKYLLPNTYLWSSSTDLLVPEPV